MYCSDFNAPWYPGAEVSECEWTFGSGTGGYEIRLYCDGGYWYVRIGGNPGGQGQTCAKWRKAHAEGSCPATGQYTESEGCKSRLHCDFCPYVLERPATPKAEKYQWDLAARLTAESDVLKSGLEDIYDPPPGGRCPYGVTHLDGQRVRAQVLVDRVERGQIVLEQALAAAQELGIDLDMQMTAEGPQ